MKSGFLILGNFKKKPIRVLNFSISYKLNKMKQYFKGRRFISVRCKLVKFVFKNGQHTGSHEYAFMFGFVLGFEVLEPDLGDWELGLHRLIILQTVEAVARQRLRLVNLQVNHKF